MKRVIKLTLSALMGVAALTDNRSTAETVERSGYSSEGQKLTRGSEVHEVVSNSDDLFKLEEDAMIIEAPVPVSDQMSFFDSPTDMVKSSESGNSGESVPVYEYNDIGDLTVHEEKNSKVKDSESAAPATKEEQSMSDSQIIEQIFEADERKKKKEYDEKMQKDEETKKHFIHDEERQQRLTGRGRNKKTYQLYDDVKVSDRKRPIYAVLSEPMKSDILYSTSENLNSGGYLTGVENIQIAPQKPVEKILNSTEVQVSYIPKAHVQFLEQSGIRVIPISYMDEPEQIEAVLDQVNGVYLAGDSQNSIADKQYQNAFGIILRYVKKQNKESDYFPMFLMGKSAQVFVHLVAVHKTHLHDMRNHQNKNHFLRLHQKHEDTFLLHQLQNDSSISHAFDLGEFFNKQDSGLQMRDIENDVQLKKFIQPLATFEGSGTVDTFYLNVKNKQDTDYYSDEEEFVAIAEGRDLPIYMFTYNLEMTQFVHTAIEGRLEQDEVIDKCIASRHHAQFVSHQIADEARLNEHKFLSSSGRVSQYLIRNYDIASVEYPRQDTDHDRNRWPLPIGLETHDVYIIKQSKIKELNGKLMSKEQDAPQFQQN